MLPAASVALGAISPTMCVRLACPARVAFQQGRSRGTSTPSDAAIVGSIAHRAIELAIKGQTVDEAWSIAVGESASRGEQPDALSRLRRARLRYQLRVVDALTFTEGVDEDNVHCEVNLLSRDGTLEGTPDLVVVRTAGCDVIDFKTGLVIDLDEETPKADFARQIRLYAHLAAETYQVPATSGVLLSFRQGRINVDVSPELVGDAVGEALKRREAFNSRAPGTQPTHAGSATCRWCEYQVICDGFWEAIGDGSGDVAGSALRGTICSKPERSQNELIALQIEVLAGAAPGSVATIAEIPLQDAAEWAVGDEISATALRGPSVERGLYTCSPSSSMHRWSS